MHVLVTCKNEDDRIKSEGARVFTRFLSLYVYGDFSRCPKAANSAVLGPIWPNFELVRDVMNVLVTCKYEEDPIKNEGARVFTTFSPLYPYGSYWLPWSSDPIWSKTKCIRCLYPMMLQIKFGYDWPTGCGDIKV